MPDVVMWVTKPSDRDVPSLETIGQRVEGLDYVSWVDIRTEGGAMQVSFEGGKVEQEEIEDALRRVGYEIFKVSHSE